MTQTTSTFDEVRRIVGQVLQLGTFADTLQASTALLGSIPHFDSLAVMNLVAALEERFDILIPDDELERDNFLTLGDVTCLVESKLPR